MTTFIIMRLSMMKMMKMMMTLVRLMLTREAFGITIREQREFQNCRSRVSIDLTDDRLLRARACSLHWSSLIELNGQKPPVITAQFWFSPDFSLKTGSCHVLTVIYM